MRVRLYICDGKLPSCAKTYCKFNGTGECMHTKDKLHARYDPPRQWNIDKRSSRTVLIEKWREE